MRILVVEDEKDLLDLIAEGLRIDGYAVDTCGDGAEAYELTLIENYDLIILDLNLPSMNGMDVLEHIRKTNQDTKILILTARSALSDKVKGLDLGANDYLTKPFHFQELEARIRSLLRRKFQQHDVTLTCGKIQLNTISRTAFVEQSELNLTKKELSLLEYLMLNQNRVISQTELIDHVWDGSVNMFSNAIRVHIASLRKKIRSILNDDPIQNRIGEGYIISDPGDKK